MYDITIKNLFDLSHTIAGDYLSGFTYPWEALSGIGDLIPELGAGLSADEYNKVGENMWVAKTAKVYSTAVLDGSCIIGPGTEVRPGAFIRGNAIVGENCVIGNSTELKNVIIFDNVQVPHYNYVGDSILGFRSHLGAGAKTSNVKSDKQLVVIKDGETHYETGRKKVGAMVGDYVEVGCNTILNPGSVVGRNTNVYPLSSVRGVVPENSIFKKTGCVVTKH